MISTEQNSVSIRPAEVCRALLAALDAADGQRRKRKRDQRPDAIGLALKREILERAVEEDPEPGSFEAWLLDRVSASAPGSAGAVTAMARAVLEEWRLAHTLGEFKHWLDRGAPSDDARGGREHPAGSDSGAACAPRYNEPE